MATQTPATGKAFPYCPVFILALCLTVNAYTLVNLFPYVGMMVKDLLGLSTTNESGYYAGYIASSFTFGRFLSGYVWGYATDVVGRKPVLISGLSAIIVCSISFGLSGSFAWAITSRFILGLLNGIMPAVRTLTHEICGPEHAVRGMAYIGASMTTQTLAMLGIMARMHILLGISTGSRGVGLVTGTAIGGLLAQPALTYPRFFSATGVFGMYVFWLYWYPFLLPNLVGALLALLTLPLVAVYVPETKIDISSLAERDSSCESVVSPEDHATTETLLIGSRQQTSTYYSTSQASESDARQKGQPSPQTCDAGVCSAGNTNGGRATDCVLRDPTGKQLMVVNTTKRTTQQRYELLPGDNTLAATLDAAETGVSSDASSTSGERLGESVLHPKSGREHAGVWGPSGILSLPGVKMTLGIICMVQMVGIGFEEAYPLWALSTPSAGGLGWGTHQIGKVLGVAGLVITVLQLGVIPHIVEHVGIVNWQRAGCIMGVPAFLAAPCAKFFSWDDTSLFVASAVTNVLVICCFSAVMLMLTVASTSVVSHQQRGAFSGLFITAESLGRFMGPASFSVMFAWSISPSTRGWVDFHFVFILPAVVMAVTLALSWNNFDYLKNPAQQGDGTGGSATVAGGGGQESSAGAACVAIPSAA